MHCPVGRVERHELGHALRGVEPADAQGVGSRDTVRLSKSLCVGVRVLVDAGADDARALPFDTEALARQGLAPPEC